MPTINTVRFGETYLTRKRQMKFIILKINIEIKSVLIHVILMLTTKLLHPVYMGKVRECNAQSVRDKALLSK